MVSLQCIWCLCNVYGVFAMYMVSLQCIWCPCNVYGVLAMYMVSLQCIWCPYNVYGVLAKTTKLSNGWLFFILNYGHESGVMTEKGPSKK